MIVVHLTSSTFFGGPERQMLGLAEALAPDVRSVFLSFPEKGRCRPFLDEVAQHHLEGQALTNDTPHLWAAIREVTACLRRTRADLLCCHGYKADLLGRPAARQAGIPALAVSRGWTGENFKVRLYELVDRLNLFWMHRVVCVSEGQAVKVRRAGVPDRRLVVIRNAIRSDRFANPDPAYRQRLRGLFAQAPQRIVGAAGRFSPEKGFHVFVESAQRLAGKDPRLAFVLFGDGPLRHVLARQVQNAGLANRFVFAGLRSDLDQYLPWLDVLVLPSFTEGLPNIVLEGCAAGIPVVATAVGGTPEVIEDGVTGRLVPPGSGATLAQVIREVLQAQDGGRAMAECGRQRVLEQFTFEAQALHYRQLFAELVATEQLPGLPLSMAGGRGT